MVRARGPGVPSRAAIQESVVAATVGRMVAMPAERAVAAVSEERVIGRFGRLVDVPSPPGDERACAEAVQPAIKELRGMLSE